MTNLVISWPVAFSFVFGFPVILHADFYLILNACSNVTTDLDFNMITNMNFNMTTNVGNMATNLGLNVTTNLGPNMTTIVGLDRTTNVGLNMTRNVGRETREFTIFPECLVFLEFPENPDESWHGSLNVKRPYIDEPPLANPGGLMYHSRFSICFSTLCRDIYHIHHLRREVNTIINHLHRRGYHHDQRHHLQTGTTTRTT